MLDILARLQSLIDQHGLRHWSRAAQKDSDFVRAVENAILPGNDLTFPEKVLVAMGESETCHRGNRRKYKSIQAGWGFCARTGLCACAQSHISQTSKAIDHKSRLAKTSATLLERYGTTNPGQTPMGRAGHEAFYRDAEKVQTAIERGRETMLERHGVDNAFKLQVIDRQATARRHWKDGTADIMDSPDRLTEYLSTRSVTVAAIQLGVDPSTLNKRISDFGIRHSYGSSYENEIAAFLTHHGIEFTSRNRSIIPPRELDFYIPGYNLAIEFNGLYYHSCEVIDDTTHAAKMEMCRRAGVRLIMINEDEWLTRREIIERKILVLCQRGVRGKGARSLVVREIAASLAMEFCQKHHLQGSPSGVISAFGAFDGEELVSVITMGRIRRSGALELTRFCTDGRLFPGVFTRMVKRIRERYVEPIVSFADLRYSQGDIYRTSHFREVETIRPDYRYVKRLTTYHKSNFTRKRIETKFGIDMSERTEREAMKSLGYSRIYDCGKIKFILE